MAPPERRRRRGLADLGTRVLAAAVFGPCLVILAWRGEQWFAALVALLALAGTLEFVNLLRAGGRQPFTRLAGLAAILLPATLFYAPQLAGACLAALLLALLTAAVVRGRVEGVASDVAGTFTGVVYVAGLFGHLILLRQLPQARGGTDIDGFFVVMLVFVLMWVSDTGAYLVGSLWGRHKLAPNVSPGKTWEGAVGAATLTAMAGGVSAMTFLRTTLTPVEGIVLGFLASTLGAVGDLVESMLKRDANIKDASAIIPGHGGVLDRFDGVLFVAPLIYWSMRLVIL